MNIPPLNPDGSAKQFYTDEMAASIDKGPDPAPSLHDMLREIKSLADAVDTMIARHDDAMNKIQEIYDGVAPIVAQISENPAKFLMQAMTGRIK